MGTLFSALDIGQAGLLVSQVQLDVTGHNIANVNKTGYSRQRAELTTRLPNFKPYGALGRGPAIRDIQRLRDSFLDTMYRSEVGGLGRTEVAAQYYTRIEDVFQEPTDQGFSNRLDNFFDALNDFSNNVEDLSVRTATLAETDALATALNDIWDRLNTLRSNANEEVRSEVAEINSLTERIASMNQVIREAEMSGQAANDLRDDRDVLIDELSKLVKVTSRERSDGQVDVLVGGAELVFGSERRELKVSVNSALDPGRPDLLEVRFVDNDQPVLITDGELYGVLQIRDVELKNLIGRLDTVASTLIQNINRIHSQGNGLEAINVPLQSTNAIISPFAPLNAANLPFTVQTGSFQVVVYDSTGAIAETITVPVDGSTTFPAGTTGGDIEAAIDGAAHLSALFDPSGILTITPEAGYSFSFANDSSGALTALGLNGLFTGYNARTIALSSHLVGHPEWLSSATSLDMLDTGDNSAALQLAALRTTNILEGNTQTTQDYYESTIVQVGINARTNTANLDVQRAFVNDFSSRRQEVSGVNLDEEVTSLLRFQRAFEASARIITVADRMMETLLNVVG